WCFMIRTSTTTTIRLWDFKLFLFLGPLAFLVVACTNGELSTAPAGNFLGFGTNNPSDPSFDGGSDDGRTFTTPDDVDNPNVGGSDNDSANDSGTSSGNDDGADDSTTSNDGSDGSDGNDGNTGDNTTGGDGDAGTTSSDGGNNDFDNPIDNGGS